VKSCQLGALLALRNTDIINIRHMEAGDDLRSR
jgi:hypothetical protein